MKKIFSYFSIAVITLLFSCSVQPPMELHWEMKANDVEPGICEAYLTIKNTSKQVLNNQDWILYFNLMSLRPIFKEGDALREVEIQASWHSIEPTETFAPIEPNESVTYVMRYKGNAIREITAPEGFFMLKKNAKPISIPCSYAKFTKPEQMKRGIPIWEKTPYADGNYVYDYIEGILTSVDSTSVELPILPQPKSVVSMQGECYPTKAVVVENTHANMVAEGYSIEMQGDTIRIDASDEAGLFYAKQTLRQIISVLDLSDTKSCANYRICDYPDLRHRGVMLDISRNFYPMDSVKRIIDVMSMCKLNVLHMHLSDDEAWRIEIPGLPALTDVGSRRGYTTSETDCLLPMYCGGWDPNAPTTANGYYSREQYIELLQYAKKNNICVIPEIDMPGHMRACKKAMNGMLTDSVLEKRVYLSAQNYTDNVIAVTNEYAITFIDQVVTEIVKMYQDAGCELKIFNIGGDEVPNGALTQEEHQAFIDKVMGILARYNLQPMGWEEIGHFCPPHTQAICYSWHNGDVKPMELAKAGYPVVLATANRLYFDFAYCNHHEEKGLNWGGYTDEYRAFDWTPIKHPNIIGMNAQLWAEVIRSFAQVEWQLFPKIFGLTERAWNNESTLSLCEFNDIVYNYELPYLHATHHNFHLQQPGIKVENGMVKMNAVTPNAKVVYYLHDKDALHDFDNIDWKVYEGEFEIDTNEISIIKAKLLYLDHESNVTWEWL